MKKNSENIAYKIPEHSLISTQNQWSFSVSANESEPHSAEKPERQRTEKNSPNPEKFQLKINEVSQFNQNEPKSRCAEKEQFQSKSLISSNSNKKSRNRKIKNTKNKMKRTGKIDRRWGNWSRMN